MVRMITIKGVDTSRGPNSVPVFAPVDKSMQLRDAIIVGLPALPFEPWQDVAWYFKVDPQLSAIVQSPGANLDGVQILVLLEA